MKNFKLWSLAALFAVVMTSLLISSCSKESDKVESLSLTNTSSKTSGNDVIDFTKTGDFKLDKTHSSVMWETFYYGDNALLTGRFNNFNVAMKFDEANPSNTKISAWVQLSTYNTGEPGRDGKGKCGPGYMGVKYTDTLFTVDKTTDSAWYNSTSVIRHGDGYLAKGNFKFRGITKEVDLYFKYSGTNLSADGKTIRAGFPGYFVMKANSDFLVNSTSISDEVKVLVNVNVNKKL